MIETRIKIDGKEVAFRTSAAVPRLYRSKFGRDIMQDMQRLNRNVRKAKKGRRSLDGIDLGIFENVAYIMAYHADPSIPPSPDKWLERFDTFSIYEVFPEIMGLWVRNMRSTAELKKNRKGQAGGR